MGSYRQKSCEGAFGGMSSSAGFDARLPSQRAAATHVLLKTWVERLDAEAQRRGSLRERRIAWREQAVGDAMVAALISSVLALLVSVL